MEFSNINKSFQPAIKFAGIIGTIGGFIGDVLSPLGPIISYLFYFSLATLLISLTILFIFRQTKKEVFKLISLTSFFFSLIFGAFSLINKDSENGFLGDNIEFVSGFQSSLNIISYELDSINNQIQTVDKKLDEGFNIIEEGVDDIKNTTHQTYEMLNTMSSQQDDILTSIEDLNNIGSELREKLGLKTILISKNLKSQIESQLQTNDYKTLFTHYNQYYNNYEYFRKSLPDDTIKDIAINRVPFSDLGYYKRSVEKLHQNDYEAALKLSDTALAINPKLYQAFIVRSEIKEKIQDNTALEDLNKAFNLNPSSFFINTVRGLFFMRNEEYDKAIKDFKRGYELTKYRDPELQSFLMACYWDQQSWSDLSKLLNGIKNQNLLINHLKETFGQEGFTETWASMFLFNTTTTVDISYIKSDGISEIGNIYFGHFLLERDSYLSYAYTNENGKYISLNKSQYFGSEFLAPKKPIIDFNPFTVDRVTLYVKRDGADETIQELRNSQNKEIFTIIFQIAGQGAEGEILYIKKGIENLNNIEKSIGKTLEISKKGQITNW